MSMKNLHQLLLERNATETDPFVAVHAANAALYVQLDALQLKCELLEREQHVLDSNNNSSSAALRNETRLRDKLERLQEELNDKLREHQKDTAQALETAKSLAQLKDTNATNQKSLQKMQQELDKKEKAILHLQQQVDDAKQTTKLAEKQYNGLKETIRSLQNENDVLRDENRKLIDRVVSEKEKTSDEINILNEMVDKLKREVDMLRTLHIQEEQRKSWFGKPKPHGDHTTHDAKASPSTNNDTASPTRKFGTLGAVVPTAIQHTLSAHTGDATCVKYDSTGFDLLVTCGTDGLVKVWDTSTTLLKATLRGSPHSAVTACDMGGGLVVGGGSDKMGRVWNLKTQRMVRFANGTGDS
jgi:autophagy-related protein 16